MREGEINQSVGATWRRGGVSQVPSFSDSRFLPLALVFLFLSSFLPMVNIDYLISASLIIIICLDCKCFSLVVLTNIVSVALCLLCYVAVVCVVLGVVCPFRRGGRGMRGLASRSFLLRREEEHPSGSGGAQKPSSSAAGWIGKRRRRVQMALRWQAPIESCSPLVIFSFSFPFCSSPPLRGGGRPCATSPPCRGSTAIGLGEDPQPVCKTWIGPNPAQQIESD